MEHHDREGVAAFYAPDEPLAAGTSASLGEGVLHHVRVRRLGLGSRIALLDGQGHRAEGTLVRLSRTSGTVDVESVTVHAPLAPVHLLVPIADRDRMLWLAEKCAELGATSWRPVLYRRSRSVKPRGEGPTFVGKVRARMAAALEQAFAADPLLRRPRPDLQALQSPRPELRSIVTHPPNGDATPAMATMTAV